MPVESVVLIVGKRSADLKDVFERADTTANFGVRINFGSQGAG